MKLSYRPEIDGLRTIAVLSVILYHAQIVVFVDDFFKGGFVGVDIFFIISGYLISRILLNELFEKGKINFLQFYERRARRILPILFTVFLISFPLAYKYSYLLPNQFIEYAHSILSATFFGSNIFFYFTNTQYGAEDSLLQPFLHTWSLGVEEQFYILFPIVLLLAYKFSKKHLVTMITILILISLIYAEWQSTKNTQLNFFMLTSRLWELGIGSLLAFYELRYGRVKHYLLNQTMPLIGLVMISYSIVFFNNQTPHPSFITLLPTLGTALIILYSINKTDLVGRVLSWKPIVDIGLISYSMYLWHYPLFALARVSDLNGVSNDEKYLLIILTVILSVISYFLIEKPFRNKQFLVMKKFSLIIFLLLIMILGINLKVIETKGFEDRLPKLLYEAKVNFKKNIWGKLKTNGKACHDRKDDFCEIGENKKGIINIVGDSHLSAIQHDLVKRIQSNYKVIIMNSAGCWMMKDTQRFNDKEKKVLDKDCGIDYQNKRIEKIRQNPKSIILLGGRLPVYLSEHYFDNEEGGIEKEKNKGFWKILENTNNKSKKTIIKDTMLELMNDGHKIIVLYPIPEVGWDVPKELFKKLSKKHMDVTEINYWLDKNRITTNYEVYKRRTQSSFELLDSIHHNNLYRLYPHKLLCDNQIRGRCITHDNENIFYADYDHPSNEGAKLINNLIIDKLNEIENKS